MRDHPQLHEPWMIAVWPGMGSVALTAGSWLNSRLGAEQVMQLPSEEFFDVEKVEVHDGLARVGWLPSCSFHAWRNRGNGPDLVIFVGEAQPASGGLDFCQRIIDVARDLGVVRVFTFAAMATQMHPGATPRVFAVANEKDLIAELQSQPVEILRDGQINGLNGVLLAAAAEAGMPGICLLGEMPFFAVSFPNPGASMAVLGMFSRISGIDLDLSDLERQGETVQRRLGELLERMNIKVEVEGMPGAPGFQPPPDFLPEMEEEEDDSISGADRQRIEELFRLAQVDRAQALPLKQELDRLGVFDQFEDRFLDLFKQGG